LLLIASAPPGPALYHQWGKTPSRQQLKWVVWGSVLAIAPFTLLYAAGYIHGRDRRALLSDVALLPLILIPLYLATRSFDIV
jgi:hypothetical protein